MHPFFMLEIIFVGLEILTQITGYPTAKISLKNRAVQDPCYVRYDKNHRFDLAKCSKSSGVPDVSLSHQPTTPFYHWE